MVRTTVTKEIIDHFRDSILRKELKGGERLPSEQTLAEMLGVGRGTIRESLQVLIHLGLLERHQRTTIVSPFALDRLMSRSVFDHFGQHKDAAEMIELRKIIEPQAAALAAERVTADAAERIEEQFRLMVENQGNIDLFIEHDNLYHVSILRASGNSLIREVIESIHASLRNSQSLILHSSAGILPRSIEFHERILAAIKNQNPGAARKHMLSHLRDIEREMLKIVTPEKPESSLVETRETG